MKVKSLLALSLTALALVPWACTIETNDDNGSGGTSGNGGADNGGADNGGADNGGADNGGADNGGADNGGTSSQGGTSSEGGAGGDAGNGGSSGTTVKTRVDVDANISAATTWTKDHVYVIPSGTVYISAALTIEPGTVIKFGPGADLYIEDDGQLNAVGTTNAHIVFTALKDDTAGGDTNNDGAATSPTIGDFDSVVVNGNSSKFDYIEFRYSTTGLNIGGTNHSIKHSTFTSNTQGLTTKNADDASKIVITDNVFYNNTKPILINSGTPVDATNSFHNPTAASELNTFQTIEVAGNINQTVTWSNTEVAYTLIEGGTYYVNDTAALTLASGVVLKFKTDSGLYFENGATLNGAATATFTSYKDDTKLGDSNGDGTASTPTDGDWNGVYDAKTSTWISTNVFYDEH